MSDMSTWRRCALLTSLKGLPRALRAERSPNRYLWWLSTVGYLCLALWQTGLLIQQYLEYNYAIKETKVTEEFDMNLDDITLPQITFCNLNPFHGNAYSTMYDMGVNQLDEYADLVNNITDCEGCVNDDKVLLSMLQRDLLTSRGYFAYVGPETATKLSHKLQRLIVDCYIYTSSTKIRCEDSQFTEFIHADYYSCWSMELPESYNNSLKRVSFIFNLDNFFTPQYDIFPINHARGQFLGVLMIIHNAGTFPATEHDGVFLQPGRFFDIKLTGQFRMMLADPYNTCTKDVYIANTSWLYTRAGCISHCIETHVIANCTCRSMDQFNLFVKEGFPKFCLDITYGKEQLLQNVRCAIEVARAYTKTCKNKCLHSCFELKYILSLTSAHLPLHVFNDEFYRKFVFNNSYVWYYYDESIFSTQGTLFDNIDYIDLVNRNFMRVDVRLHGEIILYEDIPTTTLETLTSRLGGTLNLFAGISLLIAIEIIDFILLLCRCGEKKSRNQTISPK